jgi:hypothetical protein
MLASKNDMLYYCYENVDVCCDNCHAMPILWRMYAKSEVSDMPDHIYIPMYGPKVKKKSGKNYESSAFQPSSGIEIPTIN